MLKETTRAHLRAARKQPQDHRSKFLAGLVRKGPTPKGTTSARGLIMKAKKQRKVIASNLRAMRAEHGSHLTRLWHRAGQ